MNCIKCVRALPADGRFLTCASCRNGYHLGKPCSGVADGTFAGMGAARRETWKCPTCRTGEIRTGEIRTGEIRTVSGTAGNCSLEDSGNADVSRQELVDCASVTSQLASISATLNQLLSLKASVDTLLPLPSKVDQLLALRPAVDELRSTVEGLQMTVDSFSLKYDSVLAMAMTNEEAVKDLQQEVDTVRTTMEHQADTIERLKEELNDTHQYSRRCNMELHGLPFVHGEDLMQIMNDLSQKLDVPTPQPSDILAIHRLTKKPDSVPTVLINFTSVAIKNSWMSARGRLRKLCRSEDQPNLFFNDNLTPANKELFWLARTQGKKHGYRFVWTKNSKIYAKKAEDSPVVRVNTQKDLVQLV